MRDDEAFLRTIDAAPADLLARLVYADWLEERGDPRAEFLRLVCQTVEGLRRSATLRAGLPEDWAALVDLLRALVSVWPMPSLAPSTPPATIRAFRTRVGGRLNKGAYFAEVETDKAFMELPAEESGVVQWLARVGEAVPVGGPIAVLLRS